MAESKEIVLAVFGGALAVSGLVLFFLGLMANALDKLRGTDVKAPYKAVASMAYSAFVLSIACVGLSSSWLLLGHSAAVYVALVWVFIAQLVLLAAAATTVFWLLVTIT